MTPRERVVSTLKECRGRSRAIGMGELYREVYGEPYSHRINDTRRLRTIIRELREEGMAICSTSAMRGGGYYLPETAQELEEECERLSRKALMILAIMARMKRISMPALLGQLSLKDYGKEESDDG
jgi:hypothetical protein